MTTKRPQHVLLTGAAGFVGFHVAGNLLDKGIRVTGGELADHTRRPARGVVPHQRVTRVAARLPGADERLEAELRQSTAVGDTRRT